MSLLRVRVRAPALLLTSNHSLHLVSRVCLSISEEVGDEGSAGAKRGGCGSGRVGACGRAFATGPHSSVVAAAVEADCVKGLYVSFGLGGGLGPEGIEVRLLHLSSRFRRHAGDEPVADVLQLPESTSL